MRRSETRSGNKSRWVGPIVVFVAAIVPYLNVIQLGFVGDDFPLIVENARIRSLSGVLSLFGIPGGFPEARALRDASYALDFAIGGATPWIFHVSNVAYHAVAALLVLVLARRLLKNEWLAVAAAVIFAVHPIHSETVASIAGRKDLLVTLFTVAGLWCFLRFDERGSPLALLGFVSAFAIGFLAKETIVVLPVLALSTALLMSGESDRRGRWRRLLAPALLLVLSFALVFVAVRVFRISAFAGDQTWRWHGGSVERTALTIPRLLLYDLVLLVAPIHLQADYAYEAFPISSSLLEPRVLSAILVVAIVAVAAVLAARKDRRVGFASAWIVVSLLPVLQILPHHEIFAERYLYLPSVGVALLLPVLLERVSASRPRLAWAALTLASVAATARTWEHNGVFRDFETLSRSVVESSPRCGRAQYNLGQCALREGQEGEALDRFRAAVAIGPGAFAGENRVYGPAWNEIGLLALVRFLRRGRSPDSADFREAEEAFSRSSEYWPGEAAPALNLFTLENEAGRRAEAATALARAARGGLRDERVDVRLAAATPREVEDSDRGEVIAALVRTLRRPPSEDPAGSEARARSLVEHLRAAGDPASALLVARLCGFPVPPRSAHEVWRSLVPNADNGGSRYLRGLLPALADRAMQSELPVEAVAADWSADSTHVSLALDRIRPWVHWWLAAERLSDARASDARERLFEAARAVLEGSRRGPVFRGNRFSLQSG